MKLDKSTFQISRRFLFDAAHHLPDYLGKCANIHGHRYELTVTYETYQDEQGIAYDFNKLKTLVQEYVVNILDHSDINEIIPQPTAENILLWVYHTLVAIPHTPFLFSLTLQEGRDTWVTLTRKNVHYSGGANDYVDPHR